MNSKKLSWGLTMKINLAKSAGFCSGVRRALTLALNTAQTKHTVYMLGDIVHNEIVVRQIENAGIKKIQRLNKGKGKILLIRAHGCSNNILTKAKKLGYQIVDATCPKVKEIHKIVKTLETHGNQIIVIGDKLHDEVQGIIGQLKNKAIVIDQLKNIPLLKIKSIRHAEVVAQSTQNLDKVLEILTVLRRYIPEVKFHNTICTPTRIKQNEIKTLPLNNDIILVIGSKTSANTKRIYEISKSLNKNTYWVNAASEIKLAWFTKASNIGVTAGASTPESTIAEVIKKLRDFSSRN